MNEIAPIHINGRTTHHINGQWAAPGGRTFPDYNPYSGEVVAEVAAGGRAEADAAISAADAASQAGPPRPPASGSACS